MKSHTKGGTVNSKSLNGQDTLIGQIASSDELFKVHEKLIRDIWVVWGQHRDQFVQGNAANFERFSRVSIVTLTQVAAINANDLHMTEETFLATCKANFAQARKLAPKWA